MTFSTRNFDPLTPLAPKFPNFAVQMLFRMKHTVAMVTHAHATHFLLHLGAGCCLPKTTFRTKIGRSWAKEHPKIWDPLHISATVKASNFKFGTQLGFGTSLPKTTFSTKIGGGLDQGSIQKKFGTPYVFWQSMAISNLVHKLGLGLACQNTTFRAKIGGGLARGATKKIRDLLLISATVEASNFKFSTQLGFGTRLPKINI